MISSRAEYAYALASAIAMLLFTLHMVLFFIIPAYASLIG